MSLVSVVVPCFNQAQYLSEAVESIINQSYLNWECLIINDGSVDNTETVALKLCKKDARIKYFRKDNGGLSNARNYGIIHSNGEFILPLDADDKIDIDYLNLAVNKLLENSQIKVVYCRAEFFGTQTGEWRMPLYNFKELLLFNTIFCSAVYRRKDYDNTLGYDETLKYGGEDWDFWISLLKNGGEVFRLDSVQFYYRKKEISMHTQLVGDKAKEQYTNNIIFNKNYELYQQFFDDPISVYYKAYELSNELEIIGKSRIYKVMKSMWRMREKFLWS
ncbi:glycosyl transferase [Adhaeribacter aerolatus]|uniref:Glycosyl transferase n=1 Tax=Adhaeribacter aerolatus TaxID=670289 RepID=A0A512AU31_9BACT|nr:glycosyltransferase family A protein [Adhaeribacter aerolatus]GEO03222.1 glycosyl transferase [Adhaeribacter aerolatus]